MRKPGFRHEALIYRDPEEFLAVTVPFLLGALEAGEPALVAVRRENTVLLQGELGDDAAEIRFAEMEVLGRNPARIIPFWREFLDEHGGRPVRGIGEPIWPGRGPAEVDECQRHESLLNVAFGRLPSWSLLCPYDGRALDKEVLRRIAHSHRTVVLNGASQRSVVYVDRSDCFAGRLSGRPADAFQREFDHAGLAGVRHHVELAAKRVGFCAGDATGLAIATNELALNSIRHGGGRGALSLWREQGRLVVEVEDAGWIQEPMVGRLRPVPSQKSGRGLWLVNELCDLVQIRSGSQGTTVRLQAALG